MKFKFEKLGSLYQGEVELKDLTIICGENNTGKTYIANSIYALLANWQQLLAWRLRPEHINRLEEQGVISINLQEEIVDHWQSILDTTMSQLVKNLSEFLAAPPERFLDTRFSLNQAINTEWIDEDFETNYNTVKGKPLLSIKKSAGQAFAEIAIVIEAGVDLSPFSALSSIISNQLSHLVLGKTFPHVFIASAERTGAAVFRGDILLPKVHRMIYMLC